MYRYQQNGHILWLLVKFENNFWKHLRIYCAFSIFISPPTTFETRKMPFSLSPLPYNVVLWQVCIFMYRLCQYTHPVSAVCALMPWVFNKLPKCKPEPFAYSKFIADVVYELLKQRCTSYWPGRRFKSPMFLHFILPIFILALILFADLMSISYLWYELQFSFIVRHNVENVWIMKTMKYVAVE